MSIFRLNNGDLQLGDWKSRIDLESTLILCIMTHRCNFNCSTCLGPNEPGLDDSLISQFGIEKVVDAFRILQEQSGHKLYIMLTGGEPTLREYFGNFAAQLSEFVEIGLQTNLCGAGIEKFAEKVQPERVGGIEASFHPLVLDKNLKLEEKYFNNFKLLMNLGFPIVCKMYAAPWELPPSNKFRERLCRIQEQLPADAILFVSHFIGNWKNKSYPHAYTFEQREFLSRALTVRRTEELGWIDGAWSFKNMLCNAGHGMILIKTDGNAYRCLLDHNPLGNLMQENIRLSVPLMPCQFPACGCSAHALWYGFQPWKYFPKGVPGDYNRFVANNINSEKELNESLSLK